MDLNNQLIKIVINKHEIIYVQCICLKYKIKCIILYLSQCTNFLDKQAFPKIHLGPGSHSHRVVK